MWKRVLDFADRSTEFVSRRSFFTRLGKAAAPAAALIGMVLGVTRNASAQRGVIWHGRCCTYKCWTDGYHYYPIYVVLVYNPNVENKQCGAEPADTRGCDSGVDYVHGTDDISCYAVGDGSFKACFD